MVLQKRDRWYRYILKIEHLWFDDELESCKGVVSNVFLAHVLFHWFLEEWSYHFLKWKRLWNEFQEDGLVGGHAFKGKRSPTTSVCQLGYTSESVKGDLEYPYKNQSSESFQGVIDN